MQNIIFTKFTFTKNAPSLLNLLWPKSMNWLKSCFKINNLTSNLKMCSKNCISKKIKLTRINHRNFYGRIPIGNLYSWTKNVLKNLMSYTSCKDTQCHHLPFQKENQGIQFLLWLRTLLCISICKVIHSREV